MSDVGWLDIACPVCHAAIGDRCIARGRRHGVRYTSTPHAVRRRLVREARRRRSDGTAVVDEIDAGSVAA